MNEKVTAIKNNIKNGTYDWNQAIETLAEKAIVIHDIFGSVWGVSLY